MSVDGRQQAHTITRSQNVCGRIKIGVVWLVRPSMAIIHMTRWKKKGGVKESLYVLAGSHFYQLFVGLNVYVQGK